MRSPEPGPTGSGSFATSSITLSAVTALRRERAKIQPSTPAATIATKTTPAVSLPKSETVSSAPAPIERGGRHREHPCDHHALDHRPVDEAALRPSPAPITPPETTWVVESEKPK